VTPRPLLGQRVLFVVNVDWFFLSHRLPVARAARAAGAEVVVAAADSGRRADVEADGFRFVPLPFTRKGQSPWREALALLALLRLYRALRPDLVHHVTVKPVLYGSLAARAVLRQAAVVNAISGLGFAFSEDRRARRAGQVVRALYRFALRSPRSRTIFQNPDDRQRFLSQGMLRPAQAVLIRGSGVDCSAYSPPASGPADPPVVLMSSRLLYEKGVEEFVDAARLVRRTRPDARFVLVGRPDEGNLTSVPVAALTQWVEEGVIDWLGHRDDMPDVLRDATVYCLPTYYPEGVPKALLEAGATGLALVTTHVAGCREVVEHEVTGLRVPPRDSQALAAAVLRLLDDRALAQRLGQSARAHVEAHFSEPVVVARTMELYAELLGAPA
jgi:glycosyltransferase involved in cell wall biosynthesis